MGDRWRSRWEMAVREPCTEGLLNALTEAGILFRGAVPADPVTICFEVPYGQVRRARRIIEQRGGELLLCRPCGAVPALLRLGKRRALLVGVAVCGLLLFLSNLFVWRIDVRGCEQVPEGAVLRAMENAGAGIGSFWPAFDGEYLRNVLLLELEDVQWLAVNYRSGAVEVVVRERRKAPAVVDHREPVHIIAERSGVVTSLSVKQGQACVGVGDTVERGQTLISGAAVSSIGTTRALHALGTVRGRTWHTLSLRMPMQETEKVYTGRQSLKISLILGERRLNFYGNSSIFGDTCDTITMDYHLCMEGVFTLPVRLAVQHCVYWEPREREADLTASDAVGRDALMEALQKRIGDEGTVVTADFASQQGTDCVTVTVMAECEEEIGEEIPMSQTQLRQIQSDNTLGEEATND